VFPKAPLSKRSILALPEVTNGVGGDADPGLRVEANAAHVALLFSLHPINHDNHSNKRSEMTKGIFEMAILEIGGGVR
jgi:hypothetical protein